jgi:3D (Asp-Asp-Asp) domain-containing protein
MSQLAKRRISKYVSSGMSVVALLTIGYSFEARTDSVYAAQTNDVPRRSQERRNGVNRGASESSPVEAEGTSTAGEEITPFLESGKELAEALFGEGAGGELEEFNATAYCIKGRTASGEYTRSGIIAADPRVLPLGTVVHIRAGKYTGKYIVKDTGGRIRGKKVDIYVPTKSEAVTFGRQRVRIRVIRRGKTEAKETATSTSESRSKAHR